MRFFCNEIWGNAVVNADVGNVFCIADKFFLRSLDNTVKLQDSERHWGEEAFMMLIEMHFLCRV